MVSIVRTMSLAVLVFVVIFSNGCGKNQLERQQIAAKEVEKSPAELNKARVLKSIDERYENPRAHYRLGRLYQLDGMWAKAENEYSIALSFDPVHRDAQAARVKVLLQSGDSEKSAFLANIYLQQASSSARSSLRLALAFQREELSDYAFECYMQALRLAPNSASINRQIGYYYLRKNDQQNAQNYLSRSFQLNTNQPDVAEELGRLGVVVKVPRKSNEQNKKLDEEVKKYDKAASR